MVENLPCSHGACQDMAMKTTTKKIPRSPVARGMFARYGSGVRIMHDRRAPRGGARNRQREWREEAE